MPPATAVPTECRASWPAPVANTSGSTPRMKASEVIRIGRRPDPARLDRRLDDRQAPVPQLLGELDDQDRVLRRQPDQHDQPDLAVDVVGQAAHPLRRQRAQHRQRHAEQHDERQHQALVLRRQRQVDEQQRQPEDQRPTGCPPWFPRARCPTTRRSCRPAASRVAIRSISFSASPELTPGRRRSVQRRRAEQVEVADDLRRGRLLDRDDAVERHHLAGRATARRSASGPAGWSGTAGPPARRRGRRGC